MFTVQMKKTSVNKLDNEMGTADVIVNSGTVTKKKKKKKELEVYFLAKNGIILLKAVL
jgi:galactitol-specific phosphotransferase system IIB component